MPARHALLSFLLLAICTLGQCAPASATNPVDDHGCSDAVTQRIGKYFKLPDFVAPKWRGERLIAGMCKALPGEPTKLLAAFAYDDGTEYEKQLLLAIVDRPTTRVIASYQGVIAEDGDTTVQRDSLKLDTARYPLSRSTRAFGLRLSTFLDRCGFEAGRGDELTLFVVEGRRIRPVLTEPMSRWRYGQGRRCAGETVNTSTVDIQISVAPTHTHGFADLQLTAKRSDGKKPLRATLRYDGRQYALKRWHQTFETWWEP